MLQLVLFGGDQILAVESEALERNGTAEKSFSFVLFYIHLQIGKFRLSAWIVRPYHPAKPNRNVENFLGKPMGFPHPFTFSIPYRSHLMPIDPYRSLHIPTDPYRSLQIPTDPYTSLQIPTDPYRSLQICIDPYRSLQIPIFL